MTVAKKRIKSHGYFVVRDDWLTPDQEVASYQSKPSNVTRRHRTFESAKTEAERLVRTTRKPYFVAAVIARYNVDDPPIAEELYWTPPLDEADSTV